MRLGPLRETSVQPAPKSRFVVSGLLAYEDQKQIRSFPAEAGPTVEVPATISDRSHAPRGNAAPDALRPADEAHSGLGK